MIGRAWPRRSRRWPPHGRDAGRESRDRDGGRPGDRARHRRSLGAGRGGCGGGGAPGGPPPPPPPPPQGEGEDTPPNPAPPFFLCPLFLFKKKKKNTTELI